MALIGLFIGAVEYFNWRTSGRTISSESSSIEEPESIRLLERLPLEMRGRIASLSMQDHYVEVTTERGKHLVFMRFADAMVELDGLKGTQIHRSHWVAQHAAREIKRKGNRTFLILDDDRQLAVSATYLEQAKTLLKLQAPTS